MTMAQIAEAKGMKRRLTGGLVLVVKNLDHSGGFRRSLGGRHGGLQPRRLRAGDRGVPGARRAGQCGGSNSAGCDVPQGAGVKRSSPRAYLWLNRAASRGNARAKTELREVSQSMTAEELARAKEIAQACEASNYRTCEY